MNMIRIILLLLVQGNLCAAAAAVQPMAVAPQTVEKMIAVLCSDGITIEVPENILLQFSLINGFIDFFENGLEGFLQSGNIEEAYVGVQDGKLTLKASSKIVQLLVEVTAAFMRQDAAYSHNLTSWSFHDFCDLLKALNFLQLSSELMSYFETAIFMQFIVHNRQLINEQYFTEESQNQNQDVVEMFHLLDTLNCDHVFPLAYYLSLTATINTNLTYPEKPVRSTKDGRLYAVVSDVGGRGLVTVVNAQTQEQVCSVEHDRYFGRSREYRIDYQEPIFGIADVVFSADGNRMATVTLVDGIIKITDLATGQQVSEINVNQLPGGGEGGRFATLNCIALNTDGSRLALGFWGGAVKVIDLTTGMELYRNHQFGRLIIDLAFSDNSEKLSITHIEGMQKERFTIIDIISGARNYSYVGSNWTDQLAYALLSPSREQIAQRLGSGIVELIDATTQVREQQFPHSTYPFLFVPEHNYLVAQDFDFMKENEYSNKLVILDIKLGQRIGECQMPGFIAGMAWNQATQSFLVKIAPTHEVARYQKHNKMFNVTIDKKRMLPQVSFFVSHLFEASKQRGFNECGEPNPAPARKYKETELQLLARTPELFRNLVTLDKEQQVRLNQLIWEGQGCSELVPRAAKKQNRGAAAAAADKNK